MNLDNVTVNIRPRTPWEAVDIGFVLARKWFLTLWILWFFSAIPFFALCIVLGIVLPGSAPKWAIFLLWFFKPFYEPPLLLWASKALFGTQERVKTTFKNLKNKRNFAIIRAVLFLRFSPFRVFIYPVLFLEGLQGKQRSSRMALLLKDGFETALLTIAGFFIELLFTFSSLIVIFWLIPEELRWFDFGDFIFLLENWLLLGCYFVGCSLFAPFYICAGFMIYISRRVELEAWDIEIGFKRIQKRLESKKNGLLSLKAAFILFLCVSMAPAPGRADNLTPEEAKNTIEHVLEQKDFGETKKELRWVPKKKEEKPVDSPWGDFFEALFERIEKFSKFISPLLAKYGEILLWCCGGIIIAFFIIKYSKLRNWLIAYRSPSRSGKDIPKVLFGMDLRPQSLPSDIKKHCLDFLNQGKTREAMSLLYRGTLSRLVNKHHIAIESSFTEEQCRLEVQKSRPGQEASFFTNLTYQWITIAYGHREPQNKVCFSLVEQWEKLYGAEL